MNSHGNLSKHLFNHSPPHLSYLSDSQKPVTLTLFSQTLTRGVEFVDGGLEHWVLVEFTRFKPSRLSDGWSNSITSLVAVLCQKLGEHSQSKGVGLVVHRAVGFLCADKLLCEQGGEELLAGRCGNLVLFTFKRTRVVKNRRLGTECVRRSLERNLMRWIELTENWTSWKVMT
ncbi:hypothetical protein Droror1_Dr00014434 [Drosera rotundifolia]